VLVTEAVPNVSSGTAIASYSTAFTTSTLTVSGGSVTLSLNENPVFVEPK
jgi:hypothetical protein